jgi:pSer/pThr/pTyr-binding forkhead associated (FHA) protein
VPAQDAAEWKTAYEYKYSCRECFIRPRCILQSRTSPTIKESIRNAFTNRTDTRQMWGILQENCLLIKEEEEAKKPRKESLLSQRMRGADMAEEQVVAQEPEPPPETITPLVPPTSAPPPVEAEAQTPPPVEAAASYYLIVQPSKRRIALPNYGELVLGRFDPNLGLSADVDLRYDDRDRTTVSRRHAQISGFGGKHTIEDLGSTNGTKLNDRLLELGESAPLKPGDRITLGECQLSYEPAPEFIAELPAYSPSRYFLTVTATGRRFDLPASEEVLIGRADPTVGIEPDIDLGGEDEIGSHVSRKHARLTWQDGGHHLEDLGSSFGTRVNGSVVWTGDSIRLRPGDHIWLGGCVLAYDLDVE